MVRDEPPRPGPGRTGSPRATPRDQAGSPRGAQSASCCYHREQVLSGHMPAPDASTPARDALNEFIRHLAGLQFAVTTRRIRRDFLDECLHHAQQAAGTSELTAAELLDPARAGAWLSDAAAGRTRTRSTLRGRAAAAYPNSMRVRIDSYNSFAEF